MKKLTTRCLSFALALVMLFGMAGVAEETQGAYSFLTEVDAVCGYLNQFANAHVAYIADADGCTRFTVDLGRNGTPLVEGFVAQIAENALTFGTEGQLVTVNEETVRDLVENVLPQLISFAANNVGQSEDGESVLSPELLAALIGYVTGEGLTNDLAALAAVLEPEANRFAQIAMEQGAIQMSENGDVTISVTAESLAQLLFAYVDSFAADEAVMNAVSGLELLKALNVPAEQVQAVFERLPAVAMELLSSLTADGVKGEFTLHILASGSADAFMGFESGSDYAKIAADVTADGIFSVTAEAVDGEKSYRFASSNQNDEGAVVTDAAYTEGDVTVTYQILSGDERAMITVCALQNGEQVASFDFYGDNNGISQSLVTPAFSENGIISATDDVLEITGSFANANGVTGETATAIDTEAKTIVSSGATMLSDGTIISSYQLNYADNALTLNSMNANGSIDLAVTQNEGAAAYSYKRETNSSVIASEGTIYVDNRVGEGSFEFTAEETAVSGNWSLNGTAGTLDAEGILYGEPLTAHFAADVNQNIGHYTYNFAISDVEANGVFAMTEENGTITVKESAVVTEAGQTVMLYDVNEVVTKTEEGTAVTLNMKTVDPDGNELTADFQLVGTDFVLTAAYQDAQMTVTGTLTEIEGGMGYTVNGTMTQNGETHTVTGTIGMNMLNEGVTIFVEYALDGVQMGYYALELTATADENGASVYSANVHTVANDVKTVLAYVTVTLTQSIIESPAHLEGVQLTGNDLMELIGTLVG